jgi:mycothiol synthase
VIVPAGFTARPATVEDAPAVADLMNTFDRAQLEDPDSMDADELLGWWSRLDLAEDSRLVFAGDGTLAAVATVSERHAGQLEADVYVHPGQCGRGLGSALLDWAEQEAETRGRPVFQTGVLAVDAAAGVLARSRGLSPVRHFYRMLIDLDGPPSEPEWPAGFEISTFRPGEEAVLHATLEEAFADHWGHERRDLDEWQRTAFDRDWWDPSLVYLVREGDEVAAAAIDAVRFGMGWIGMLGTRPPWRGRGLGRALLLTSFGELYRRGERRIGLAVDAGNETGATHLYESVGMRIAWQADVYEKRM